MILWTFQTRWFNSYTQFMAKIFFRKPWFNMCLSTHIFKSEILKNYRTVWIQKSNSIAQPTCIFFLDGELYLKMGTEEIIANYQNANRSIIACFISSLDRQTRFRENACYFPFAQFISDELIPWFENESKCTINPEKSIICGLSLTGLTSAFIGMVLPKYFRKILSQSGAFWWNNERLIDQVKSSNLYRSSFYLCVGNKEKQININHYPGFFQTISQLDSNRRMRDLLISKDALMAYEEVDGSHSLDTWKRTLPGALYLMI